MLHPVGQRPQHGRSLKRYGVSERKYADPTRTKIPGPLRELEAHNDDVTKWLETGNVPEVSCLLKVICTLSERGL
jgi:hypothetical protein